MFVFNCTIDQNRVSSVLSFNGEKSSKKKRINQNKRFKSDETNSTNSHEDEQIPVDEILRPIICSECGTELGVYEPKEELYHFANVLASH